MKAHHRSSPNRARFAGASALVLASTLAAQGALAQTPPPTEPAPNEVEEVVVTGSYIQRAVEDTATPVSVIGTEELEKQAIQTSDYLFKNLPMASGARSTPDSTNSPYQLGMANVNLRGLGVASTLTLINGRRQVVSPVPLDDGSSFVDINTIPLIMVERLEVLQDGGAALYGSDAIAGVANFIMRRSFEGLEVRGSYQTTTEDSQEDYNFGAVGGLSGDRWNFVAGIEGLYRTELAQNARPFSAGKIRSALGSPGAFAPVGGGLPRIDPNCAAVGGIPTPFAPGGLGLCGADLTPFFSTGLVAPEQRVLGYATGEYRLSEKHKLYAELGFAHNEAKLFSAPSYSNLSFPVIPANNPGNLVANGGYGIPVIYYGRPLNGLNSTPNEQRRRSDMVRFVIGAEGDVNETWGYNLSYTFAQQLYSPTNIRDTLKNRFIAALNGVGGPNNNQFFNPFGTAFTNPALANDPKVIADFTYDSWRKYNGKLHSAEAVFTGSLGSLPGGPIGVAVGGQLRRETLDFQSDPNQQSGNLVFLFSGPDTSVERDSYAVFGESVFPIAPNAEIQLQGRYEHYSGGIGGSFNPKIAGRWEPVEDLVLRASASTSFRAPSLSQVSEVSTINAAIIDPFNPSLIPFFNQILSVPGANLEPETATNLGAGVAWSPLPGLDLTLDYWRYDYQDLIVKENAQAIVNANPNDPRIIRAGGDPRGLISQVRVNFVNQNAVLADGADFSARYRTELEQGEIDLTLRGTYMNQYTTTINGKEQDVSGKRNFSNFARSLPKWRSNLIGTYSLGPHDFTTTVNYISSYNDFLNPASPIAEYEIKSFTTIDLQYSLELEQLDADIAVGVLNVSNIYPPNSRIISGDLQGFDRFVHDPRGRLVYVRATKRFF
jgi:outer membrane receptor protein involved in Fe transport